MQTVGIRELKDNTTQLLRRVREDRVTIEITYYGEVIARIIPIMPASTQSTVWTTLDQLSAEIGAAWQGSADINEIMSEERG